MDTIFALSSGQPPAAIGIVRVSGPEAGAAVRALCGAVPQARRATVSLFSDPATGEALDRGLVLWFPGPATATGEDLAEFHCHGGRAVTAAILAALGQVEGLRPAQPGEFTRRAYENGRIDLSEAEGLSDLLFAETESQRRAAMAMAEGAFSRKVADWQERLLILSAMTEAALDFSDEDDVPDTDIGDRIAHGMEHMLAELHLELRRPHAETLREGIRVVLAGPPNAGKSTLLNALVGRDAAIVSDIAGTTRDRIEVPVAFMGMPFLVTDTAGLRDFSGDVIEAVGIARTEEAVRAADILLWLGDPEAAPRADAVTIATKKDLDGWAAPDGIDLAVSARSGEGMDALVALICAMATKLIPAEGGYALHARQRREMEAVSGQLTDALDVHDMLLVAEHLRAARTALDRVTGRAGTEDMLDALFGKFCIGK
ncbi:MAG TPA: tRNA uridine-5-carboxymethylaminomethyl(34) synthesis GTPase MnmE [Sphingobium sp.]